MEIHMQNYENASDSKLQLLAAIDAEKRVMSEAVQNHTSKISSLYTQMAMIEVISQLDVNMLPPENQHQSVDEMANISARGEAEIPQDNDFLSVQMSDKDKATVAHFKDNYNIDLRETTTIQYDALVNVLQKQEASGSEISRILNVRHQAVNGALSKLRKKYPRSLIFDKNKKMYQLKKNA